jgi:hypothetical protein
MQDGKRKGRGLAGAGLGDADDVTPGEGERNGLGLDGCGGEVIFFLKGTRDGIGEAEILKGGQKEGSFRKKAGAQRPSPGARKCLGDTRVFGASIMVG